MCEFGADIFITDGTILLCKTCSSIKNIFRLFLKGIIVAKRHFKGKLKVFSATFSHQILLITYK